MLGFDNYLSKMLAAAVKTGPKEKNYRCRIKLQWVPSRAVRRQKKVAKKSASYRRLYIVIAVLEASGRQALLL